MLLGMALEDTGLGIELGVVSGTVLGKIPDMIPGDA